MRLPPGSLVETISTSACFCNKGISWLMTVVFPAPSGPSIVINNPFILSPIPFNFFSIIRYFHLLINQIPIRNFTNFFSHFLCSTQYLKSTVITSKTRLHQIPLSTPTLPFPLHNTILKNSTVITKKTCRVLIVAVMGIRIKGELTGVRNLFLTPVLNFEGERLQARAGPSLQLL